MCQQQTGRMRWAAALVLLLTALVVTTGVSLHGQAGLRILVTNDDGIESPGIQTLADALRAVADEVVVVAPDGNRSGSSHATTSGTPLTVRPFRDGARLLGYDISGFPADAVRLALLELGGDRGFDLVVSGINRGTNVGNVAHLSGTVGAAMEALFQGVPAIAVSQDASESDYTLAAAFTVRVVVELQRRGFPPDVVLSINVPSGSAGDIDGVVAAAMDGSHLQSRYERQSGSIDETATYVRRLVPAGSARPGTDTHAYHEERRITITPLRFDWTDEAMVTEANSWGLMVP